jgi:predicted RNA-binding protein
MKKVLSGLVFALISVLAYAAGDTVSAVEGSVKRIDAAGKTITVKTADGAEHTFHMAGRTAVHGGEAASDITKESWHGLREGSDVVVHYTKRGTEDTAEEIDRIGEGGLKETKGTISKLDRDGKKIVVKGDDGVEHTYDLSENAARDAGKDIAEGSEKSAKVTVYYAEKGERKVVHFFKAAV